MGTQYYLARTDNGTLFELGKVPTWKDAFPYAAPARISGYTVDQLAGRLIAQSLHWDWGLKPDAIEIYCREVATKILAWSDKRLVRFISEHDKEYEEHHYRVTGSRFAS